MPLTQVDQNIIRNITEKLANSNVPNLPYIRHAMLNLEQILESLTLPADYPQYFEAKSLFIRLTDLESQLQEKAVSAAGDDAPSQSHHHALDSINELIALHRVLELCTRTLADDVRIPSDPHELVVHMLMLVDSALIASSVLSESYLIYTELLNDRKKIIQLMNRFPLHYKSRS